jgi:hypothetical protein
MSPRSCARVWEVEAAHDGRLPEAARAAHETHRQQCSDCAQEQLDLAKLNAQLRARSPLATNADQLGLRRVRSRVLDAANRRLLRAPRPAWKTRARLLLLAALVPLALLWAGSKLLHAPHAQPEAVFLRLSPAPGTRYRHERKADVDYVDLEDGQLGVAFTRSLKRSLVMRVPDGEVRDVGTVFRVTVRAGRTRAVSVSEGAVVLHRPGRSDVFVKAGQHYDAAGEIETPSVALPITRPVAQATVGTPAAAISGNSPTPPHAAITRASITRRSHAPALVDDADAEDRAYLRILALLREGRAAEARIAAREYGHDYPAGFRRAEVERIAR